MAAEHLTQQGELKGHEGWVTSIATTHEDANMVVSASRDQSLIVWRLNHEGSAEAFGTPVRRLTGHSHFVQDVVLSADGQFALSASWDGTLRLWNLATGSTHQRFIGHAKDVLTVAFSPNNHHIVSGGRDRSIKLWTTKGECKQTIENAHSHWVSCVRFSPNVAASPMIVSCGWDKLVKVWQLSTCSLQTNLVGHSGYLNTVTVSPDGSLCASGGKDGVVMLWDLNEGKRLYSLDTGDVVHSLVFSPNRYWLCAATSSAIKIWNLETKQVVDNLVPSFPTTPGKKAVPIHCTSLCWSPDGSTLFSGYTDNIIRVWLVSIA